MSDKGTSFRSVRLELRIDPVWYLIVVLAGGVVLAALSFGNFLAETYRPRGFHLDGRLFTIYREANIPTWYQVVNFTFASFLAFAVAQSARAWRAHWYMLSFVMLFFSLDELTQIHERMVQPVRAALDTSGFFYFAWVIPGMVFVALFALAYLGFLLKQPRWVGVGLTVAGIVFVAGAIGMEGMSASFADNRGIANIEEILPQRAFWFTVFAHVEELLEVTGITLFNFVLLRTMAPAGRVATEAPTPAPD